MKTRNPFVRLVTKVLVLALLLTGLGFVSTSPSMAAEDPCSACYTSYFICIADCWSPQSCNRCEWTLDKCLGIYNC